MSAYNLTNEEDFHLHFSIMFLGGRCSFYEYLCKLPLEYLQAYPKQGYHWWMGKATRTHQALALFILAFKSC